MSSDDGLGSATPDWKLMKSDDSRYPPEFYWGGSMPVSPGEPGKVRNFTATAATQVLIFRPELKCFMEVVSLQRQPLQFD